MGRDSLNQGSYNGKLLRINLTDETWKLENISAEIFSKYIGGRGLGVKILCDEIKPNIEPLSSENKLILASGPLTGTSAPTGCRYEVITKSPLTGTITGANAGGNFGTFLKRAGLDAIIIEGCATQPVYLKIFDNDIEFRDAHELWGADTHKTTDWITDELENKKNNISVACIGPAGEGQVLFACIINDKHRAAGRGGAGAVMGAKLLKAIAVGGTNEINVLEPDKFKSRVAKIRYKIKTTTVTNVNLREYGTAKILDSANDYKLFGTRNFRQNYFEDADKINAEQLKKQLLVKSKACYGCPIPCKRVTSVDGRAGEGPEFESIWAFGAQCGVNDLKAIARASYTANELGLDSISTGNTIGLAMELSENGFIKDKLSFGDPKLMEQLVEDIGYRKGLGDDLASGSFRFAEANGHPELSMSVKSLELPAYDPRCAQAQGLGYATSTRGACHVRAFVVKSDMVAGPQKTDHESINEKTKMVIRSQNKMAVIDSLGMCLFSSFVCDIADYRGFLEDGAGVKFEPDDELLKAGERIWNMERIFNIQAGFTKSDDTLPERFKSESVKDDLGYEHVWPERELIEDYYNERGWDVNGVPRKSKLKELGW
jgi:aldehyde:ferredoxin oxidoreductase